MKSGHTLHAHSSLRRSHVFFAILICFFRHRGRYSVLQRSIWCSCIVYRLPERHSPPSTSGIKGTQIVQEELSTDREIEMRWTKAPLIGAMLLQ